MRNKILRSVNALNKNVKSKLLFKEKSKTDLSVMYSTLFWCLLIISLDFQAQLQNNCNIAFFSSYKVSYFQWSPVMRHQCIHYKGHVSPMACKLLYTLFSCGEFGVPVVAFDGVEYLCKMLFCVSLKGNDAQHSLLSC